MIEKFALLARLSFRRDEIKVILDLGCREGFQTIELSKAYPQARIFGFECNPVSLAKARNNTRGLNNVTIIGKAVHHIDDRCKFYPINTLATVSRYRDGNPGASSLFVASGQYDQVEKYVQDEIEVEATRLDTWARENGIDRVDLVWMDLQGAELFALMGMGNLLGSVKAICTEACLVEIYREQALLPELHQFLIDRSFRSIWKGNEDEPELEKYYVNIFYVRKNSALNFRIALFYLIRAALQTVSAIRAILAGSRNRLWRKRRLT